MRRSGVIYYGRHIGSRSYREATLVSELASWQSLPCRCCDRIASLSEHSNTMLDSLKMLKRPDTITPNRATSHMRRRPTTPKEPGGYVEGRVRMGSPYCSPSAIAFSIATCAEVPDGASHGEGIRPRHVRAAYQWPAVWTESAIARCYWVSGATGRSLNYAITQAAV